jgi:hypothetical protein
VKAHILIAVVLLAVGVARIHAATITVTTTNDSGPGSLRAALAIASNGDTIDASSITGTIVLTSGELLVTNSVDIIGPGPDLLAVNGNAVSRVFHVGQSNSVSISSLTITNGMAPNDSGGGILNGASALLVSNVVLAGNSADVGGGIANGDNSTLDVIDTLLSDNSANGGGGILNNNATLTVSRSALSGNTAGVFGGGIWNVGYAGNATLQIVNTTLSGNSADQGGGVNNYSYFGLATAQILNSTLSNSLAGRFGGGICDLADYAGAVSLKIASTALGDNIAGWDGGAIANVGGNVEILGSTLSGNSVSPGGGGFGGCIWNVGEYASVQLTNCTLSRNSECIYNYIGAMRIASCTLNDNSGGLGNVYGTVEIGNTVLAPAGIINDSGTVTSLGYNLNSDDAGGFLSATGDQVNTDPRLGPLQDNGGPTFTHALLPGSPAINAGDPNYNPPPDFDQRGPGFPRVACGRIDVGAFEVQDTVPPVITCPDNVVIDATSPTGAVVDFTPTASDDCSSVSVASVPASGSVFAIGDTTVQCTATDGAGNQATCSFTVHVKGAGEQIGELIALVQGLGLPSGSANSLVVKMQAAANSLGRGNTEAACGTLGAFLNEVAAQSGKKLTAVQADALIADAMRIRAMLGC